jgi:putative ABC transport system permease protein
MTRWLRFFRRARRDAECEGDIEFYLATETEENIARGLSPEEARAAARRKFGNPSLIREEVYQMNTAAFLDAVCRDLLYALRGMRSSPAFVVTAMITLALGIGANTAIFSVIRAVMLRPLEFQEPERLVYMSIDNAPQNVHDNQFGLPQFEELRTHARSFEAFGAYGVNPETVSISGDGGAPEALRAARVSANFLDVLGVRPVIGRSFIPEEDQRGGPCVALISFTLWKRRFGGDPSLAGRTATLDSSACTVLGVLPPGFEFPFSGADVWVPRPSEWSALPSRFWNIPLLKGFARLKPGVTLEQASAEVQVLHTQYVRSHQGMIWEDGSTMRVVWLKDRLIADVRPMLWMLLGAVALVLLIACANVASLLVARGLSRSHQLAVQAALGAGRGRLIGQLLIESLVLSFAGGTVGVLLASWMMSGVKGVGNFAANGLYLPGSSEIRLNGAVLLFTLLLCAVTGVAFGLVPALHVSRPDLADVLRERGAGRVGSSRRSPDGLNLRSLLAAGQVALSVVLLIGSALVIESIERLRAVNPGFQTVNLLTVKIALPGNRYDTDQKKWAFFEELARRVETLPGVRNAAVAMSLPTTTNNLNTNVQVDGQPRLEPRDIPIAQLQSVSPDYFRTLGIPIRRGRDFAAADDRLGAKPVVIINESFARRFCPSYPNGLNPVGQHMFEAADKLRGAEIVGIVGDVRERALSIEPKPEFYVPSSVHAPQTAYLAVRTGGEPLSLTNSIRDRVLAIDSDQAISDVRTMENIFDTLLRQRHLTMVLLSLFAGVALVLALVGIYGVTAYSVTQRTQEVGIRRALGARQADILRLVLGHSLAITLAGVAGGVAGAFAITRVLRQFLYQVSTTDPVTFVAIAVLFTGVALIASFIPARRATRVDPMDALRVG